MISSYDPMAESIRGRQELMERANSMFRRAGDTERGRQLLGYELRPTSSRPNAPFVWAHVRDPQLAGLPAGLIERATAAAAAADAAVAALDAAEQRFAQWVALNRPSQELFNLKHEEMCIGERAANTRAQSALDAAALELATAAADLDRIRRELAAIPDRIRARRQECQVAEQADQDMERDLRAQLAKYGFV